MAPPTTPETRVGEDAGDDETVAGRDRVNIVYRPSTFSPPNEEVELPLKILVVGDHTGREDPRPVEARATVPLDKERFDEVMAAHALRLDLTVPDHLDAAATGARGVALRFECLADFTPDRVVQQVPELRRLMELRGTLIALKGPLGGVPAFKKSVSAMLHSREGRARLAREVGVELPGSVGRLGLPRLRWGPYDVFTVVEEHVDDHDARSVFVARMELRFGVHVHGSFELARSEHAIAFVRVISESGTWLVVSLEVLDAHHIFPLTLVVNAAGRIPCAFLGELRGPVQIMEGAFAAIFWMRSSTSRHGQLVPVHVDLTRGEVRGAFALDVTAAPPGARADPTWVLLGGNARLHTLRADPGPDL